MDYLKNDRKKQIAEAWRLLVHFIAFESMVNLSWSDIFLESRSWWNYIDSSFSEFF